jgi:DNA primase
VSEGFGADFKELVRASTNLVDLVAETVPLTPTRNGTDYIGLCPFHDDKNPSFHVYPDRQTYRCWVCDKGGDCFTWVQEDQVVSFPEAIRLLAQRANLELPKQSGNRFNQPSQKDKASQYEIVEWAISLMQQALRTGNEGELARNYLAGRELSDETIRHFRLGFHPENWSWFQEKAHGRFSKEQLLSVGLVGERDNGRGFYDNLVGRVVFPILDERDRPVAFGGRVLPGSNIESPAKYWNSPETDIFHKRKTLYAFNLAKPTIRDSRTAIVVEGYMDCISCHQAGVRNVVATLGTALADEHVRFLKRFADRVVLTYDGDDAGRAAAERAIVRFLAHDLDLRILTLPEGLDPSDFISEQGVEQFNALVAEAPEAWEYKLRSVSSRFDAGTVSGRQTILNEMLEFLAKSVGIEGTVREDLILRNVCWRIQTDETKARQQLGELRKKGDNPNRFLQRQTEPEEQNQRISLKTAGDQAERELLEIILSCPEHTDYIRHHIGPDDFYIPQHRRLLELCFDLVAEAGELPEINRVIEAADSESNLITLINTVIDSAQEKGISKLMAEHKLDHDEDDGGESIPLHLERVLHPLLTRRARNQNLLSKQKMAQTESSASKLNNDAKEVLRRIYSFRQGQLGGGSSPLK